MFVKANPLMTFIAFYNCQISWVKDTDPLISVIFGHNLYAIKVDPSWIWLELFEFMMLFIYFRLH